MNKSSTDDIILMPSRGRKKRRILPTLIFLFVVGSMIALIYFIATHNEKLEYIPSPTNDSSNANSTAHDSLHH